MQRKCEMVSQRGCIFRCLSIHRLDFKVAWFDLLMININGILQGFCNSLVFYCMYCTTEDPMEKEKQ